MTISDPRLRQLRDELARSTVDGTSRVVFHLRELLGEGGQGWVYRASYDDPDGPPMVVKLLRPDVVSNDALARFLREAEVLKKLSTLAPSPSLIRFFDHGIHRITMPDREAYSMPFIALEYVQGTNLQKILAEQPGKGLPAGRTRRLLRQIVRAVSMVHGAQIVHRDIKPSNILVTTEAGVEVAKLTDFGLVKRYDIDVRGTLMMAGASTGYAPPEQFEAGNKRVSARTDVFSLAAVTYECLTASAAFPVAAAESGLLVLSRMLSGERPTLAASGTTLAPELAGRADLIAAIDRELTRALSADPDQRHATVEELWAAIEESLRQAERPFGSTARLAAGPRSKAPGSAPSAAAVAPVTRAPDVRVVSSSLLPETARAIAFAPDGHTAYALGRTALFRFRGGVWAHVVLPAGFDTAALTGLLVSPAAEVVLFGQRGALFGLSPDGSLRPWAAADPDLSWVGGVVERSEILLVGTSAIRRVPVVGILRQGGSLSTATVEGSSRLLAATRLESGNILACGEAGELAVLGAGPARGLPWGRTGHLFALARTDDGVHIVGTGGHALLVARDLGVRLEPVQTTRDLFCVTAEGGQVLAGGTEGRLVRRTPSGWTRVPLPKEATGTVRAITIGDTHFTCAHDDGLVVAGRLDALAQRA